MRNFGKLVGAALAAALVIAATVAISTAPAAATTAPVVVSRVAQTAEGKKYLEVDGQPFMVGHVQNAGMQETLGNQGGQFGTPLPLSWVENLFEKTKDIGYDTISIILRWRDWEPTTRGVYDWTVIDKYVEWAEKYGLRIDFAYFGSNSCGGTRLTGHNQGWATFVPDYLQDKDKYFGNGLYVGVNHMPWLPDGGPHDADARFVMNSEVNAVKALFDHLAVKDTTHRTVMFQVLNEPDWHGKYNTDQKPLVWNWINALGNAVKNSNYVVATRVNSGGNMPFPDFQAISKLSGIDAVGNDTYTTSVEVAANVIRNQSVMGGTGLPHIAENDGSYGNHTSLQVTTLVNGGYYDTWELDNNNGQAMYSDDYTKWTIGTPGVMRPGTTRMSYLMPALSKISPLVSTTAPHRMAGFNIDTDNPVAGYNATKTVYNYQVGYQGADVAMALSNGNYVYAVSDTATSGTFTVHRQPVAVTSGHQDSTGTWVTDATKSYTDNGNGTYSVTYSPREAIRIELPAATGTAPPAVTPAPYSNALNVAPKATATASTSFSSCFGPVAALDGVAARFNYQVAGICGEWASSGELSPWMQLNWTTPQRINEVALFDRPNATDNVNSGTLSFSDGTSVNVTGIGVDGTGKTVTFPEKNITWVRFHATAGTGINVGLSEFQAFLSPTAPRPSSLVDIGPQADVTASSVFNSNYVASKAVDGISGQWGTGEWASLGEMNPWIKLSWTTSRTLNKVTFYDRSNTSDWAPGGTLSFSDGSSVAVSGIPNNGTARSISFPEKNVTWVKFQVSGGSGSNVGLSEVQVYSSGLTPSYALSQVAGTSTATASSQFNTAYPPSKATDGNAAAPSEWASAGELNPWIRLDWTSAQTVNRVVLYDRPNTFDNVNAGTLRFSDGSTVPVSGIPADGTPYGVTFPNKSITWVKLEVSGGTGANVGLSELQVVAAAPPSSYLAPKPDVGWWKFDEARGTTAYGSASVYNNGVFDWHNATMTNASTAAGKIDNALDLNGTDGYAMITDLSSYSLPNDTVTYSAWVYADGSPASSSVLRGIGSTGAGLSVDSSGKLTVQALEADGTTVTATDTTALTTATWQHVAVVADGSKVKLYRNGSQVAAVSYDGTLKTGFTGLGIGVKPNATGAGPDGTAPGYWSGMIDEVRIYANALNDAEIMGMASLAP